MVTGFALFFILGLMIAPYVFSLIHKIEKHIQDKRRVVEKPLMLARLRPFFSPKTRRYERD